MLNPDPNTNNIFERVLLRFRVIAPHLRIHLDSNGAAGSFFKGTHIRVATTPIKTSKGDIAESIEIYRGPVLDIDLSFAATKRRKEFRLTPTEHERKEILIWNVMNT